MDKLRENLAEYAHNAWSGWMDYLFAKGIFHDDGTFTMPAWAAERWRRQANISYEKLPDGEKGSDRLEADKILEIVKEYSEARAAALQSQLDQSEQFWRGKLREAGAREEELRHLAEMVLKYQRNHSWELKQIIYAKAEELVKSRPEEK